MENVRQPNYFLVSVPKRHEENGLLAKPHCEQYQFVTPIMFDLDCESAKEFGSNTACAEWLCED